MTPPHAQLHIDPAVSALLPPIVVRNAPGSQVPTIVGTQGIGVSTPSAAAVAAATVGFARLEHMPNGGTLTPGAVSVTTAAGRPSIVTREMGSETSEDGARPNVHWSIAPVTAQKAPTATPYCFEPLADVVRRLPEDVMKQMTLRSRPCSQLRGEGKR
jgi:hypothetical protein